MKKFVITGNFKGVFYLVYNEDIFCMADLREAELSLKQITILCQNLPVTIEEIMPFCERTKLKAVEQNIEVTFDEFYNLFGNKVGKVEAQRTWGRMSKADQVKAYLYIPRYKTQLKIQKVAQLYPASYLNAKRWED